MTTTRQALLAHIASLHTARGGLPRKRMTLVELQRWHGNEHHRLSPNHFHEGVNLGPGSRPPGWKTGEGAVPITRGRSF